MKKAIGALCFGFVLLAGLGQAQAVVPQLLPVQGMLADGAGAPIDGATTMAFSLYNVASGGSAVWSETYASTDAVDVQDGFFTVYLGSINALTIDLDAAELWLGITVGADAEMPRIRVATVPFALEAQVCREIGDLTEEDADALAGFVGAGCPVDNYLRGFDTNGDPICSPDLQASGGTVSDVFITGVPLTRDRTGSEITIGITVGTSADSVAAGNHGHAHSDLTGLTTGDPHSQYFNLAQNETVVGNTTFNGTADFNNTFNVDGAATFNGATTFSGSITAFNSTTNIFSGATTFGAGATYNGTASFNSTVTYGAASATTFGGAATFNTQPSFAYSSGAPFAVTSTTTVANLSADRIDGFDSADFVPSRSCTVGYVLKWDGDSWECGEDLQVSGGMVADVVGTYPISTVEAGGTVTVDIAIGPDAGMVAAGDHGHDGVYMDLNEGCAADEILKWDGDSWECAPDLAGTSGAITSVVGNSPITATRVGDEVTVGIGVGPGAGQVAAGDHLHTGVYAADGHNHDGVYTTQAWVTSQGYATQAWVTSNYVSQTWLTTQNFATQSWVTSQNYATQAWVNGQGFVEATDLATVATTGQFGDLLGVPASLADGDDDTLAGITCTEGYVLHFSGGAFSCTGTAAIDITGTAAHVAPNAVTTGEILNGTILGDDIADGTVALADVSTASFDTRYAQSASLAAIATSGSFNDLSDVPAGLADGDDDTLAGLSCSPGYVPKWDGFSAWACQPDDGVTVVNDDGVVIASIAGDTLDVGLDVGAVDHNGLANLATGDPHTQYLALAQNETVSGDTTFDGTATFTSTTSFSGNNTFATGTTNLNGTNVFGGPATFNNATSFAGTNTFTGASTTNVNGAANLNGATTFGSAGATTFNNRPAFLGGDGTIAPFTVDSSVAVGGLNADMLDGMHAAAFVEMDDFTAHHHDGAYLPDVSCGSDGYVLAWNDGGGYWECVQDREGIGSVLDDGNVVAFIDTNGLNVELRTDCGDGQILKYDIAGGQGWYCADDLTVGVDTDTSNDHGTLAGLTDDDHPQYLNLGQNETVTGSPSFNAATPFAVGNSTLIVNLNADLLDGQSASAFATTGHGHAATDITSGTLSTDRYSAYADLGAEGYLDNSAAGDLLTQSQGDGRYFNVTGDTVTGASVFGGATTFNGTNSFASGSATTFASGGTTTFAGTTTFTSQPAFNYAGAPFAVSAGGTTVVTNLNADMLDGRHATAFVIAPVTCTAGYVLQFDGTNYVCVDASGSHNHDAAYVNVTGDAMTGALTIGVSTGPSLSATNSSAAGGQIALRGTANGGGTNQTHGVYGESTSTGGNGVFGLAGSSTSGAGVVGQGLNTGVRGASLGTTGTNYGVYGVSASPSGYGVYGAGPTSATGTGVYGQGQNGVYGWGSSNGVFGQAQTANAGTYGVQGIGPTVSTGTGVYGAGATGVWGSTGASTGVAVYGTATDATGVNYGVYGTTSSPNGYAGYFNGRTRTGALDVAGVMTINNSTLVSNLNADLLDGVHASAFAQTASPLSGVTCNVGYVLKSTGSYAWGCAVDEQGITSVSGTPPISVSTAGGVATVSITQSGIDHGSIGGLGDNDHPQYFRLAANDTVTGIPAFNGGTSGMSAPFSVDSTYVVANLNADLLDGLNSSSFASSSHNHDASNITSGTLSTDRYSAYSDLTAEGYLDNNATGDLLTQTQGDGRYFNVTGDTVTGVSTFNANVSFGSASVVDFNNGVYFYDGSWLTMGSATGISIASGAELDVESGGYAIFYSGSQASFTSGSTTYFNSGSTTYFDGNTYFNASVPQFNGGTSASTPPFTVDSYYKVTNLNCDYLDGADSSAFATSSHNHDDAYVNVTGDTMTGTLVLTPSSGVAINASTSASANTIYSTNGYASGVGVHAIASGGNGAGVMAENTSTSGAAYGVLGYTSSSTGYAVYGSSLATTGTNYGVYGKSASVSGYGVYGQGPTTTSGYGVYGQGSTGVRGETSTGYGVIGVASSSGTGVSGVSSSNYGVTGTSTTGTGGYFSTTSGTHGLYVSNSGGTYGGYINGGSSYGLYVTTSGTYGIRGYTSDGSYGVYGRSASTTGTGVYGYASASSGTTYGVYGVANSTAGYGGYFDGNTRVDGVLSVLDSNSIVHNATLNQVYDYIDGVQLYQAAHVGGVSATWWGTEPAAGISITGTGTFWISVDVPTGSVLNTLQCYAWCPSGLTGTLTFDGYYNVSDPIGATVSQSACATYQYYGWSGLNIPITNTNMYSKGVRIKVTSTSATSRNVLHCRAQYTLFGFSQ